MSAIQAADWRGVVLADGETVVKEYHASQSVVGGLRAFLMNLFAGPGDEGGDRYLAATTQRLLLVGETQLRGGEGRLVREVHIDRISGLSCSIASGWMAGWALFRLIWKALLGLGIVFVLTRVSGFFWLLIVVWLGWLIRELMSHGQRISLEVHGGTQSSAVSITSQTRSGAFSGHFDVFDLPAGPGQDSEVMTAELGALIKDIQANPEAAVERWASQPETRSAAEAEIRSRIAPRLASADQQETSADGVEAPPIPTDG
jgi:hypothetical protein